jgi:hypothetical protein
VPNKLRHLFEELSESAAKGEQLPNIVARNSEQLGTPEVFRSPGEVPRWNSDNSVPCEGEDRSFPIFSYGSYIDHIYIYIDIYRSYRSLSKFSYPTSAPFSRA